MAKSRTGVTFHDDMVQHYCLWDPEYPECPQRFTQVLKRCTELGLIERCIKIPPREASNQEILAKHTPQVISLLEECQNKDAEELEQICSRYDSIYICPATYKLAKLATGSTIDLVKEICNGTVQNGMAIVRPPGHHAMKSTYCGYCFFNNVALAADYALKNCNISRILIVDWDVHHGQATQQMFYDDKRVLYFSIHRFEYGTFWPNLRESDYDHIGEGDGKGYNFNVPLNKIGFGNAEYLAIFNEVLLPVAIEYDPELIIISSGYDAAIGCPEGEMKVEPVFYAHLIHSLTQLAGGKVAVVLEGGYFLKSLAEGAALSMRALLGDPCPNVEAVGTPDEIVRETIRNVIYSHRETWNCFKIYDQFSPSEQASNCHNPVIRFEYDEEPLEIFPTQGAYPTRIEDIITFYNDWLDDLIECTDLRRPKYKCLFISEQLECDKILDYVIRDLKSVQKDGGSDAEKFFQNIKTKNVEWEGTEEAENSLALNLAAKNDDSFITRSLIKAIRYLQNNIGGSIAVESSKKCTNHFLYSEFFPQYLKNNRSLIIDLHHTEEYNWSSVENILSFRVSNGHQESSANEKYNINVNWNNASVSNFEYVTLWLKTVLPICYHFAPESILILIDFDNLQKNQITDELPSHLVHQLSALARGRIIIVSNKIENEFAKSAFTHISKALTGEVLPNLRTNGFSKDGIDVIKKLNERLETTWPCLNTFVKFPTGKTVL